MPNGQLNPPQPFGYSIDPDPANRLYSMSDGNAAPVLAVWLFLVTNVNFQVEIYKMFTDPGYTSDLVSVDAIARYTNLTPDAVKSILGLYAGANDSVRRAFGTVAGAFQSFGNTHSNAYRPDNCIETADPILNLAAHGADVDPSAAIAPHM